MRHQLGGGHVLHLVCDLSIAADNARFGQTGPRVGSFDAGLGAGLMARTIGLKRAKEIWLLCRQYDAATALTRSRANMRIYDGVELHGSSAEEFTAFQIAEQQRWRKILEKAGLAAAN